MRASYEDCCRNQSGERAEKGASREGGHFLRVGYVLAWPNGGARGLPSLELVDGVGLPKDL
jgi:hypothetical protein